MHDQLAIVRWKAYKNMGKTIVVDRVVSLGANCEAVCNIRSYYRSERAFPFDWWITPYNALIALLKSRFEGLLDPHNLVVTDDMRSVRCNRFNILHHHDFLRDKDGKIVIDIEPQIQSLREKYKFLIDRFYQECQTGRTLFVRNRTGFDPNLIPDSDDIFEERILNLHELLATIFPKATIYLMSTNVGKRGSSEKKDIIWDEITNYHDANDYRISPRGWTELFDRQGFKLEAETSQS